MKISPLINRLIYALAVILSLIVLWLVQNAPADFLNARVVYQGF
jgi:hypothetical protein